MSLLNRYCVKLIPVLGCCTVLLLSGCGLWESQPENLDSLESKEAKSEHLEQLQGWIFPSNEAESARRAFVQRCVAASGGQYTEAKIDLRLDTSMLSGISRDQLRETGYAVRSSTNIAELRPSFDEVGQQSYFGHAENGTVSASFMEYSTGEIPVDGCMAQSYQYIYGSAEDGMKAALLAPSFARAIVDEVVADQEYIDLQTDWSSCMAEHDYADLSNTDKAWDLAQKLSDDEENRLADTDADCRESVQFEETIKQIQNNYYEAVYQRVKKFDNELEAVHATSSQRVEEDRVRPQDSSPIELPDTEESSASAG